MTGNPPPGKPVFTQDDIRRLREAADVMHSRGNYGAALMLHSEADDIAAELELEEETSDPDLIEKLMNSAWKGGRNSHGG